MEKYAQSQTKGRYLHYCECLTGILNCACLYLDKIMRIVIQRVFEGWVKVQGDTISHIKEGVLVLVGLTVGDNKEVVEHMVNKTLNMRLWDKEGKPWNNSVIDIHGEVLAVSQFTLYGTLKGNKPDFHASMKGEEARPLFDLYVELLKKKYQPEKIQTGRFGTLMEVGSVINGPVTIQY